MLLRPIHRGNNQSLPTQCCTFTRKKTGWAIHISGWWSGMLWNITIFNGKTHYKVGGLEDDWIMTFHSVGNVIIPTDFHIFQRARYTTNQTLCCCGGKKKLTMVSMVS